MKQPKLLEQRPIFILGCYKSGTSLLRNLLDSHSELFAIPVETQFITMLGNHWVKYPFWAQMPNRSTSAIESIYRYHLRESSENNPYSDSDQYANINAGELRFNLSNGLNDYTDRELFMKYAQYLFTLFDGEGNNKRIVEKSVSHIESACYFNTIFPDAYFIHVVRNPYANMVSFKDYLFKKTWVYPSLKPIVDCIASSFYFENKNSNVIKNYLTIRYEDLVTNPIELIKKICVFLEISFEENLLSPTVSGNNWGGNSVVGEKFSTISPKRIGDFKDKIQPIELKIVNKKLKDVLGFYNYQYLENTKMSFYPAKKENIKTYFYNRLSQYFL